MIDLDQVWRDVDAYRAENGLPPEEATLGNGEQDARIKELEAENEKLRKELNWFQERLAQGLLVSCP
ncbi:MAG: hypothetical protein JO212_20985 [Acetobacteraceae bacterium]|nr:hypothetical protein [Acetobacteraceae bacterium]